MANIKIGNDTLYNVNTLRVKDADSNNYINFTLGNNNIYENISYNPMNNVVNNYIAEVDYTNQPYTFSSVRTYCDQSTDYRKDEPNGFNIEAEGTKYIILTNNRVLTVNNNSNSYNFYNFVPDTNNAAIILNSNDISKYINVTTTEQTPIRMINVPSVYNVRDHGGWTCDGGYVKYGLLYRGGSFTSYNGAQTIVTISEADKRILKELLGIGCEIDFMFAYQGGQLNESALGSEVEYICIPTNASYENLVMPGLYKDGIYITEDTAEVMKEMLEKIFNNVSYNIPTYYHCSLGADRTGTLGFIIDAILGMPQSDVDKEWELTSFAKVEKGSSPRERNATHSYWRYPDLVYYFIGGDASRTYENTEASTYKANHTNNSYEGFGKNNLRDNVAQWMVTVLGISLNDINKFRRNMIEGNPIDIVL